MSTQVHTLPIAQADTIEVADTLAFNPASAHIRFDSPPPSPAPLGQERQGSGQAASWVLLSIVVLFVAAAWGLRDSLRYTGSLLSGLLRGPGSKEIFTDTMRETTFLSLLLLLCVASCGLLLWEGMGVFHFPEVFSAPHMARTLGICALLTLLLYLFQWVCYWLGGKVFAPRMAANEWLRSFRSSQALAALLLFPLSLIGFFSPQALPALIWVGAGLWVVARILFVVKGLRIFNTLGGNYLIFFYYLCSVEIVPVLIVVRGAETICAG